MEKDSSSLSNCKINSVEPVKSFNSSYNPFHLIPLLKNGYAHCSIEIFFIRELSNFFSLYIFMEAKLKNVSRKCFETEANGFKVILDFPQQSNCEMEETQLQEVKQIMLTLLKEQTTQKM